MQTFAKPAERATALGRCRFADDIQYCVVNMSDSYTNLLYHIVFSTVRRPLTTSEIEPQLSDYIGGFIRGLDVSAVARSAGLPMVCAVVPGVPLGNLASPQALCYRHASRAKLTR